MQVEALCHGSEFARFGCRHRPTELFRKPGFGSQLFFFSTRSLIFGGCSTRVFPRVLKTEPGTRGGRAAGGEPLLPPGPRLQRRRPRVLLRRGGDFRLRGARSRFVVAGGGGACCVSFSLGFGWSLKGASYLKKGS